MIDLNDNNLPENIIPWGSTLLNWAFAQPEIYEQGYTPWEKHFDQLLEKFQLEKNPTKLTLALIIILKMYFVELKFDEEESENEEEKIKIFMEEAEGRINKVLSPSAFLVVGSRIE